MLYLYNDRTNRLTTSKSAIKGFKEISKELYDRLLASEVAYIDSDTGDIGTNGGKIIATSADGTKQVIIDSNSGNITADGDIQAESAIIDGPISANEIGVTENDGFDFIANRRPTVKGTATGLNDEVATMGDILNVKPGIQKITIAGETSAMTVSGNMDETILTVKRASTTNFGVAKYNSNVVTFDSANDSYSYLDTDGNVRTALATKDIAGVVKAGKLGSGIAIDTDGSLMIDGAVSPLEFVSTWDPVNNDPELFDDTGIVGYFYIASKEGTHDFSRNGTNIVSFKPGDWALYQLPVGGNAGEGKYVNVPMGSLVAVSSVNGKTGIVVLDKTDIGLGNVKNVDQTDASNILTGVLGNEVQINTNKSALFNAGAAFTGRVSFMRNTNK